MTYLVDGSNLLGALGMDRESDDMKRGLARMLGNVARAERTRVVCVFDGARPDGFATNLGAVAIRFAHPASADELITREIERSPQFVVVTSDRELGARVRSRKTRVESCSDFRRRVERSASGLGSAEREDWESYFSDPKNRNI